MDFFKNPPKNFSFKTWLDKNSKELFLLALLVFIVYLNALNNDFVSDDIFGIVNRNDLGTFGYLTENIFIFPGRKLLNFISFHAAGNTPWAFRIFNVIFHTINVWLVYFLLQFISNKKVANYSAAIFAVHPILVESITWITGGAYAKYSTFFLLSFIFYYFGGKNRLVWSIFFFLTSLAFGAGAIMLPFVIIIFEVTRRKFRLNWKLTLPYFGLLLFGTIPAFIAIKSRFFLLATENYSGLASMNPLLQIPTAVGNYIRLIFWPSTLSLYQTEIIPSRTHYIVWILITITLIALAIMSFRKKRYFFFWLSFFFLSLAPTLTPLPIAWVVAERYVYLGSIGIITIFSYLLYWVHTKNSLLAKIIFTIILAALSVRTIRRNIDWKNQDNLWIATAKTAPSSPNTHNNLGDVYGRHGNLEAAAKEFKLAIEINPNYADAYHNLANTYRDMGELELAKENYLKALEINPRLWQSHQNLAAIYFGEGNLEKTKEELLKALEIFPSNQNLKLLLENLPESLDN